MADQIDTTQIRLAAEAIIGHRWTARPIVGIPPRLPLTCIEILDEQGDELAYVGHRIDAHFIQITDPATVLALLDELDERRAADIAKASTTA